MANKIFLIFLCALMPVYCHNLKEAIITTESFFANLIEKYESKAFTNETKALIDQEIDEFVENTLKKSHIPHHKKHLPKHGADKISVNVFNSLVEVSTLNKTDTLDLHFFKKHNLFFRVVLIPTDLIVYQVYDSQAIPITYHPVPYSSKLHVCKFMGTTWFIVKHSHGLLVLHFFHHNGQFIIREVQSIGIPDVGHSAVWCDHTQMLLSISSTLGFYVYTWFGGSFRLVEYLPTTVNSSIFLEVDGSINLVILQHRKTTILTYTEINQRFVATQSILKSFNVATTIQISNSMSIDHFLVLSNNRKSVLYKLSDFAFVPFQEIDSADQVASVVKDTTMILFLAKNDSLSVYQYDGWRFVRVNYELNGIEILKSIVWRNEEHLIVKDVEGKWSLMRLKWSKAKARGEYIDDIKRWCSAAKDKARIIPKFMSEEKPIEVSNVNLHKITANSVNGISAKKLQELIDDYKKLLARFEAANDLLIKKRTLENPHISNLQAKVIRVAPSGTCHIKNLVTELPCDLLSKLPRMDDKTQSLRFENVHVDTLEGFPCPKIGVQLEDVQVDGLINGMSLDDILENALRISGDQVVTAEHTFEELHVDSLIAPNIAIASTYTRQAIRTEEIHAEELILTEGGLLLPLDGEPVTMTGTITAKNVTFNNLVELRGKISGRGIEKFSPMAFFPGEHELKGNYTFGDVRVLELLVTEDIVRDSGKSVTEIIDNVIPLDADVPVHLHFLSNRTIWSNITVENLPNWVTRQNAETVTITGEKIALKDVKLPDYLLEKLPIPIIETPLCANNIYAPEIEAMSVRVKANLTVDTIEAESIEGAQEFQDFFNENCVTSLDQVDLSKKVFTGPVFIENLTLTSFKGSPLESFETAMFKWDEPEVLKGPITLDYLNVTSIYAAEGIKVPLPSKMESLVVEGNLQVKTLNGIDIEEFMKNVVRIDEPMELNNVTFEGSVETQEISTITTNINLDIIGSNISLGNKTIIGDLIVEGDFTIPIKEFPSPDEVKTYIIDGSVIFKKEPSVVNLNGKNLEELMDSIWMMDRPANLTGNVYIKNLTLTEPFEYFHLLNTPNLGPWSTLGDRLLSKTKSQKITSKLHFREARMPNIISIGNTTLTTSDPYLNDLLYMTVKKDENATITEPWRFETLIVKGDLQLEGKINNLNFSTDVARHDVEVNVITGKKTVQGLAVENLSGLKFDEWAKDVLFKDTRERVVITGEKTFDYFHGNNVTVSGTVMGKKIERCLMKYGDQVITAPKVIQGSLQAPKIIVKGLINGMNFSDVALNQLTKNASLQTIESDVMFTGNLHVLGNITIRNLQGVDVQNTKSFDESFTPLMNAVEYLKPYAAAIETVYKNRAKYWRKFEEIPSETLLPANEHSSTTVTSLHRLGKCVLISVSDIECNGHDKYHLKPFGNSSVILVNEILSADEVPLVVQVSSGTKSRITIHQYDYRADSFGVTESIRVPGITKASVLNLNGIVWIVAQLNSEMLVLRYESWGDLQKYYLSSSMNFALDRVPATDEAILVRDDGMWKFDGLAGPRIAFKVDLDAEKIETFHAANEFFVRLTYAGEVTKLLKARYVGV